ncbi:DUF2194 domain-containing protein [Cohnella suwonensis]|uniref:DUF2194 domain-containing protein n=1 Tax=Cohnella suwonensis TaxID=696072 RepID=A0ABW0LU73_9BACL
MRRKPKIRLKREVYLILLGILVLGLAVQITQSQFVLEFSENEKLSVQTSSWKRMAEEASLKQPSGKPFCLAFDGADEGSILIEKQTEQMLRYMKKPTRIVDVTQGTIDPTGCEAVIAAVQGLDKLGDPDRLANYVEEGGYAFFTQTLEPNDVFYRLYRKLGILNVGDYIEGQGIKLTSNVLIGEKGLVMDDPFMQNSLLTLELDDDSRIMATTAKGVPMLWDRSYGKGKFMVFNGTMLEGKLSRGLLAGAISMLIPDFIYPIFNSKVVYIDDFPAPIRKGIDPEIYREYKRDIPAFFRDIWWPGMLKAAKQNNVLYTAVVIESYNDRVEPPFDNPSDAEKKGLVSYGREVIKSEGEIGIHGYNHQSLQTNRELADEYGYNPWNGVEPMAESLKEAVRFIKSAFPSYKITTYVPPSNVFSQEGREALKKSIPNLAVIASIYNEDASGKGYVQEYKIADDGILEMPRISSGYLMEPSDRWASAGALTSLGHFSHFLHPDDMFDPERSRDLDWKKLYESYDEMLSRLDKTYPWLRAMTSTEAANDMAYELASSVEWTRNDDTIRGVIEPFKKQAYFFIRTDKHFKSLEGCDVQKIDDGTYLITARKADFTLKLG